MDSKIIQNLILLSTLSLGAPTLAEQTLQNASSSVEKPVSSLNILNKIEVGGDWMGIGFGSVWEASGGLLYRISGIDNSLQAKIPVGPDAYRGIAIGESFVFVPATGNQTLYKIDPFQNKVVGTLGLKFQGSEASVGVSKDSVWIITEDTPAQPELSRVDIESMSVVSKTKLPSLCAGVVYAFESAWLACPQINQIIQVDGKTGQIVASIATLSNPRFITSSEDSVWVLNQGDGSVQRVDPKLSAVSNTIDAKLMGGGGDIAYGEGAIWVTLPGKPVSKIDPATNTLSASFVGSSSLGDAIRAGFGAVWVSGGQLNRIQVP